MKAPCCPNRGAAAGALRRARESSNVGLHPLAAGTITPQGCRREVTLRWMHVEQHLVRLDELLERRRVANAHVHADESVSGR